MSIDAAPRDRIVAIRAAGIALGVTHVLADPQFYGTLRPVLDARPQMFSLRFADGRWAVYEVNRGS